MHRYLFIDTLRGLSACWVVLFHLNEVGLFPESMYQSIVQHGWLGVTSFFIISGFSVHLSLLRSKSVAYFLGRRFWRIYPPLYCERGSRPYRGVRAQDRDGHQRFHSNSTWSSGLACHSHSHYKSSLNRTGD